MLSINLIDSDHQTVKCKMKLPKEKHQHGELGEHKNEVPEDGEVGQGGRRFLGERKLETHPEGCRIDLGGESVTEHETTGSDGRTSRDR